VVSIYLPLSLSLSLFKNSTEPRQLQRRKKIICGGKKRRRGEKGW